MNYIVYLRDTNATVFELFQSLVVMILVDIECSISIQLEICS